MSLSLVDRSNGARTLPRVHFVVCVTTFRDPACAVGVLHHPVCRFVPRDSGGSSVVVSLRREHAYSQRFVHVQPLVVGHYPEHCIEEPGDGRVLRNMQLDALTRGKVS